VPRDNADIGDALGNEIDDLVTQPLFEIDADMPVRGEERTQRVGQKFGERVGVGENPHLPGQAVGIDAQVLAQDFRLRQDRAGMLQQRPPGLRRTHPLAATGEQGRAQGVFHVADAGGGRPQSQMGPRRAMRDAAGFDDVTKQREVREVKTHTKPSILTKANYAK
jgi:hypothetical protein